jgi:hypothetical protein
MPFLRAARPRRHLGFPLKNRVALLLLFASAAAFGQSSTRNPTLVYQDAILEKQTGRRILALEKFVSSQAKDPLRVDAMELLVWNYKQIGNQQKAASWAQQLVDAEP